MSEIIHGDCLEVMRSYPDNHFTGIVCDPPYGLGFMGKKWDAGLPHGKIWQEALRIIKPGGHLLAFGGTRTYHRLTCAIEDAGWEIRDCVFWLYGSGFPKSHNHFGLEGYGTALKPAVEPCVMAMRPIDGTYAQNAEKWGLGGINIDACRVATRETWVIDGRNKPSSNNQRRCYGNGISSVLSKAHASGRWPANLILDEEAGRQLDITAGFNPSRFFYCAKASPSERNEGCAELEKKIGGGLNATVHGDTQTGHITLQSNNHPTIKPLSLMRYLITLIAPPTNALILDPFAGSGSTVVAAHQLGIQAIGIEKEAEYIEIARARLRHVEKRAKEDLFGHTH